MHAFKLVLSVLSLILSSVVMVNSAKIKKSGNEAERANADNAYNAGVGLLVLSIAGVGYYGYKMLKGSSYGSKYFKLGQYL